MTNRKTTGEDTFGEEEMAELNTFEDKVAERNKFKDDEAELETFGEDESAELTDEEEGEGREGVGDGGDEERP